MPYISKQELDRLRGKDSLVDALLAVEADRMGKKKESKALFKSMEEKMKAELGVDNLDEWADKEYKQILSSLSKSN